MSDDGATTFNASGDAYDRFMGRYSRPLADEFADFCGIGPDQRILDVGCGPGALTAVAVARAGADSVTAIDPSPGFVEACRERHPGVHVGRGSAERIPFDDDEFDCAAAQLVLYFVSDPELAALEMSRVVRPGGTVGACAWALAGEMTMLRAFWDAALSVDPEAPDEAQVLRFGEVRELAELFVGAGLSEVTETTLTVTADYLGFDELWSSLLLGIGPAGAYLATRSERDRTAIRVAMFEQVGSPVGSFRLSAGARAARGFVPS